MFSWRKPLQPSAVSGGAKGGCQIIADGGFPSQSLIITAFGYLLSVNCTGVISVQCQSCTQLGEGSEDVLDVFLEDDGWWWLLQLVLLPGQLLGWLLYPSGIYIIPNIPPAPLEFQAR